jgi:hypothetical protein
MPAVEARSRYNSRPEGVAVAFQVRLNKIEPRVRFIRLLTKDDVRPALLDEWKPERPKVARIFEALAKTGFAEGPTRTGTGPNRSVIWPSGAPEAQGPESDASEEVDLGVSSDVFGLESLDRAFVDDAMGNLALLNEMAEPGGFALVVFVVEGTHRSSPTRASRRTTGSPSWPARKAA